MCIKFFSKKGWAFRAEPLRYIYDHKVHRVAAATFWRTFHHDGKICPWAGVGGGYTPISFHSIYHQVQSCGVRSS
jgi:hypothetical protein